MIITCRTSYVQSTSDQNELLSIPKDCKGSGKTIYINKFTFKEKEEFINHFVEAKTKEKEFAWGSERYLNEIKNNQGLMNLTEYPFLLRLVLETLPTLNVKQVSRYTIYEEFTKKWFYKECQKNSGI